MALPTQAEINLLTNDVREVVQDLRDSIATINLGVFIDPGTDFVGIGTDTPTTELDVNGTIHSTSLLLGEGPFLPLSPCQFVTTSIQSAMIMQSLAPTGISGFIAYNDQALEMDIFIGGSAKPGSFLGRTIANRGFIFTGFATEGLAIGTDNAAPLDFSTNGTVRMTISSSGGMGFFGGAAVAKPTGVAVSALGIHAALVSLGLIGA